MVRLRSKTQLDRTAWSLHDQLFFLLMDKNSYGANQHPSLPLKSRNPYRHVHKHCYSFNFSSWSPVLSAYIIFRDDDVGLMCTPISSLSSLLQQSFCGNVPCKRPSPSLLPFRSSFLLSLLTILCLLCVAVAVSYHRVAIGDVLAALLL